MVCKKTGYFKSFDKTPIYYEVRGEGPPLVFVYGIGCLMNHWSHQVKYFSKSFETITLDYRAHHKSETPKDLQNLSINSLAQDIHELTHHLGITKASFWGHSFGTQVLTAAYPINPEVFEKLIFINGFVTDPVKNLFGNDWVYKAFQAVRSTNKVLPDTLGYIWKKAANNPLSMYLSTIAGGFNIQLTHFRDIEIYARGMASIEVQSFLHLFEEMMKYNGTPVLSQIRCPTLIIAGQKDHVIPWEHQMEIRNQITNSEWLAVPMGSHCAQLDMPDLINLRAEKFLKETDDNRELIGRNPEGT